jgi:hypothetical protein
MISGCSTQEILPNLCFDDRNGTYMCGIICNEDKTQCIDLDNPDIDLELEPEIQRYDKELYPDPEVYLMDIGNLA